MSTTQRASSWPLILQRGQVSGMVISSHEEDWHSCNVATDSLLVTVWILPAIYSTLGSRLPTEFGCRKREEGGEEPPRIQDISALGIGNQPPIGRQQGLGHLGALLAPIRAVHFRTDPLWRITCPGI
jgi:hypothetical protein